ncbi:class I SAM-dependent methyltransferase [Candidatus Gribaldobacteria bacterium]|nr:class I SAM-dependent methyltransferase [Candidatus Gribaldobacteria bacterium]
MFYYLLLIFILLLIIPTAIAGLIGAPLALTNKKQLKEIVVKAEIKPNDIFYDLGCGTGRVLVKVQKQTKARVVGFEMSPIYWLISWLNLKINQISQKNGKVYLRDFFKADLSKANLIFLFLMPKPLNKLEIKLKKELNKGSKIISYCFPLPNLKPYLTLQSPTSLPAYFYKI